MLRKVRRFFDRCTDNATPLRRQLLATWSVWSTSQDPELLVTPTTEVLGQGDPNLTNCMWDGQQVSLIDFEYGGWSNRPYELALLIEHVQSRATPDGSWSSLLDQSDLSTHERPRMPAARRLVAWFWAMTFWPADDVDDEKFTTQGQRVAHLLASGTG